ncbi:aromatic ring-hydroxylating oxygenase subunit alpha [Aquabacterium sp. J223]|uniref:aromatic ring-hydroxylating oxygenase subunit alpha n=1 Tax=Aquabacterium sp. J223 TaxID=2898431 RepID=UPI0021AE0420|nr:aromatic ring-hydroxylating dioxygenase subunit alpha [Aquabacterium sp. J223]UUX95541.1 aromatic ring-hydroxylating dioxygenase subunit alpha [Aquabacterium sp. J223]
MNEHRLWHPVARPDDLRAAGDRPLTVTLLGDDLVLWRDDAGTVQAFPDRCPHRGARLSLGRLRRGTGEPTVLACAYHGWRFAAGGACVHIPAAPGRTPAAGQAVRTFATREAHGLVWVRLGDEGDEAPPAPAGLPARAVVCGPFDVATSAPRAVENFLDTAHFGYVHDGWLGDLAHTEVPAYEVERAADGRPSVPHYLAWQPKASSTSTEGRWIDYRYEVLSPYAALLVKTAQGAGSHTEAYALWASPQGDERCRVWFTMWTSDADVSDQALIDFETTIFLQDKEILESQRPRRLPVSGGEAHGPADRLSVAYRRYLQQAGITCGVC